MSSTHLKNNPQAMLRLLPRLGAVLLMAVGFVPPPAQANTDPLSDLLGTPGSAGLGFAVRAEQSPYVSGGTRYDLRLLYVQALREAGKTQRALDEVEKLLARDSRNARGFNALGLIYYRMEKHALADSALRRATELDPKDADAWTNLGLVEHARGNDREAFEAWSKATSLDGDSAAPALNQAAVLLDCGDYKRARTELEKASRSRPDDLEVLVALGVAHRGLKEHERARQAYERALELRADYPPALFNLGVLYMDFLPDKKKARQHLILYRKVAPSRDPRVKEAEARLKELR
jgi:Flp pilus assembly protein TadD